MGCGAGRRPTSWPIHSIGRFCERRGRSVHQVPSRVDYRITSQRGHKCGWVRRRPAHHNRAHDNAHGKLSTTIDALVWMRHAPPMRTFDDRFASDGDLGCLIWADEPTYRRVRFSIGRDILIDVLGGRNPIVEDRNLALCQRERQRIEAACQRAFNERPSASIGLQARDFR